MIPITALLEPFEKFINEHGSATILRERLELLKDKFLFLEKENIELKKKLNDAEIKNKNLEAQIQKFTEENEKPKYQESGNYEEEDYDPLHRTNKR